MRCDRTTERNNFDFSPMSDQDRISPYNFKKKKKIKQTSDENKVR